MAFSIKTLAQSQPAVEDFSCLNRQQKEAIAVCFKENSYYKTAASQELTKEIFSPHWKTIAYSLAVGLVAGAVIEHKLAH